MPERTKSDNIPLTQFILLLEKKGIDILRKCAQKNNQFSTKFVIQKIISTSQKQVKDLRKDKSFAEKLVLPMHWIENRKLNQDLKELTKPFDTENLNFIEAAKFGIILNEYLIHYYRSLESQTSSRTVKKIIQHLISSKVTYVSKLKKEYVRLSKES